MKFLNHWWLTWQTFTNKEKIIAVFFVFLFIIGIFWLYFNLLNKHTELIPEKGGALRVGLIGQPQFINPIFAQSDVDLDLMQFIYDSLVTIDKNGEFIPELAEKIEVSQDGRIYTVFLRDNIFWHDGIKFTADDVIFTIETIQNPLSKSPFQLRWQGIEVEKIGDNIVRFHLQRPYEPFFQNLVFKIIPRHIWQEIDISALKLAEFNLKPIGTGPFSFYELQKNRKGEIINYTLINNLNYFKQKPYIQKVSINFYESYEETRKALLFREIDVITNVFLEDWNSLARKRHFQSRHLILPRYYAVFFNLPRVRIFSPEVRKALSLAVNYQEIKINIFYDQILLMNNVHDISEAKTLLINDNWQDTNNDGYVEKLFAGEKEPTILQFTLTLPNNENIIKVTELLKRQWQEIGVRINLNIVSIDILKDEVLQNRDYEALLFGNLIGLNPDLYPFWHSSQINYPGLNLSGYQNRQLDALLEERRNLFDTEKRNNNIEATWQILKENKPAIFLYNPHYLYVVSNRIKGNEIQQANFPAEKFADIEKWYIYRQRQLKSYNQ